MTCKKCGQDNDYVVDSRPSGNEVRRRRQCNNCGYRWTTYEILETEKASLDLARRQRNKIVKGLKDLMETYASKGDI